MMNSGPETDRAESGPPMADFVCRSGWLVLAVSLLQTGPVGPSLASGPAEKPRGDAPWQRLLTGPDATQVAELDQKVAELSGAGSYAAAQGPARAILALRMRVQ